MRLTRYLSHPTLGAYRVVVRQGQVTDLFFVDKIPPAENQEEDEALKHLILTVETKVNNPKLQIHVPLLPIGTQFQIAVWQAIRDIPAGETRNYSEIAEAVGSPTAHRAVANACGSNRIAVLIPCHRVVRKAGGLGGYRWGADLKEKLLAMESS